MADTADEAVVISTTEGRVRVITLNRPEKLNAFNGALFAGLADALESAHADDGVNAVILTGNGRAFSAGADLAEMASAGTAAAAQPAPGSNPFERLLSTCERFSKPLIGAANGLGVGLGFTILGYCDFVFVAEGAKYRAPFIQLGLAPEASSSFTFPTRMGWPTAALALLTGKGFTGVELVECGFALKALPDAEVLNHAREFAAGFNALSLPSLMATKSLMLQAQKAILPEIRRLENDALARLAGGEANRRALEALRDR